MESQPFLRANFPLETSGPAELEENSSYNESAVDWAQTEKTVGGLINEAQRDRGRWKLKHNAANAFFCETIIFERESYFGNTPGSAAGQGAEWLCLPIGRSGGWLAMLLRSLSGRWLGLWRGSKSI